MGLTPERLLPFLPKRLQAHEQCGVFLDGVLEWVGQLSAMHAGDVDAAPADLRDRLLVVAAAATTMRQALPPLEDGSDVMAALQIPFDMLAWRARRPLIPAEREAADLVAAIAPQDQPPAVPGSLLPPDVPRLAELLRRLDQDLQTLRVACEDAAARVHVDRNPEKRRELRLVVGVATRYRDSFGELPPERGLFAEFIEELGKGMGWRIGWGVVGKAVKSLSDPGELGRAVASMPESIEDGEAGKPLP